MKVLSVILIVLTFFTVNIFSQESSHKSLFVTVYNDNLGVIRDIRSIDIKKGTSKIELSDVAQQIDPTSVHIKLNGEVLEQNYQYDLVSLDKILQKYVDRNIELIDDKGEVVQGKLLSSSAGQIVLQKKDGGLVMIPNVSKYRFSVGELPDGLITKPTLIWLVNSPSSGNQDVEVSYQTGGMKWHAEYVAVLNKDDSKLDLNSWVSIDNNSGTSFKDAHLKLVAGDVNRIQQRNAYQQMKSGTVQDLVMREPQFQEKAFFEYHIYNLQRPTTLANNETKQISLFEASNVKATKKYFYQSGGYYYYNQPNSKGKVAVVMEFENKKDNNLGIPMPEGKVRVYKSDGESLEFVGEDMIDHTPKDEKVRLKIGDAFDITAKEVQTDNKRISDKVSEQAYEITFKNHKQENVVIEVQRYLGLNWEVLSSSINYQKKDSQNIIFKVPVAKDGETVLKFRIRYVY
jgi:hypothetical protein